MGFNYPEYGELIVKARKAYKRSLIDPEAMDEYRALKSQIPCASISAVMYESRKEENMKAHTGLICIDIDGKDNPHITDWSLVKEHLSEFDCVAYIGLSLSGNGLFVVMPIDWPLMVEVPDLSASAEERRLAIAKVKDLHVRQFKAIQDSFLRMGLVIDKACSNLDRLRILSLDEEPYYNEDASSYPYIAQPSLAQAVGADIPHVGLDVMEGDGGDLDEWLTAHNIPHQQQSGKRMFNVDCPWEHLHTSHTGIKQTCVWEEPNGKWCFHCFHGHCADKGWPEYREAVAPRSRALNTTPPRSTKPTPPPPRRKEEPQPSITINLNIPRDLWGNPL